MNKKDTWENINKSVNNDVIIYGTGTVALKVYEVLKAKKHSVKFF